MKALTQPAWHRMDAHASELREQKLSDWFAADPTRARRYFVEAAGIKLDYSKNFFTDETETLLGELCTETHLKEAVQQLFSGTKINNTEDRAALHSLLRAQSSPNETLETDFNSVATTLKKIATISEDIRNGKWLGTTGKPIRSLLHIGIGGSFLGPNMIDEALSAQRDSESDIACHYVANVDAHHITQVLAQLDPEETLVIIVSKTFSTLETKANAETAKAWLASTLSDVSDHLLAVSTNIDAATGFGVKPNKLQPMWDWVGGRYSLWSAVGIPIAIRYGFETFETLLRGAAAMDEHFQTAPFAQNIPVLLGFLGCFYQQCFGAESHAVLTYDHRLRLLPDHLQQLDMESNGKSVTRAGETVAYNTGAIIWGGEGTNGQHAFHQLLHQGTRFVGIDFIFALKAHHGLQSHHDKLIASCLSQAQALMQGRSAAELSGESSALKRAHKVMSGNKPSNTLAIDQLTPATVGALVAMYEHKVFVQAVFWDINPFDQWGVELGKELGQNILAAFDGTTVNVDASTQNLISIYKAARDS